MNTFKNVFVFLIALLVGRFIVYNWTDWFFVIIPALSGLVAWTWYKWSKKTTLINMNKRFDDVFLVTETPEGKVDIPHLDDLIIHVRKQRLKSAIKYFMDLIERSGNKHGIKVVVFVFQDGEYVNETPEEFEDRVRRGIEANRAVRHAKIKEEDPDYYISNQHGADKEQFVFNWDVNRKLSKAAKRNPPKSLRPSNYSRPTENGISD